MARVTIIAHGTRGDAQPAISLGLSLLARGHRVRVVASMGFRAWIEGHGLEAAPSGIDMETTMRSEQGQRWVAEGHNPLRQQGLMRAILDEIADHQIRDAWTASQDADLVIAGFTSDAYAVAIGERLGIPVVSLPLQPTSIATADGRAMVAAPFPNRSIFVNRWFGRLILEPFPWRLYGEFVNRFRREIGLAPQTNAENVAARRRMTVLHAVSPKVMPLPADWPANFHVTGYCFLDEGAHWIPPEALVQFLADGPAPVAIGFGSMTERDPEGTNAIMLEAVRRVGARAVLLGGWSEKGSLGPGGGDGARELAPGVLGLAAAPHDWLFPRCAAVVHHGGAGTTAAGLRAGRPSVIVPHFADQPYWGRRVHALGAGPAPLPRHRLTVDALAGAIRTATTDAAIARRASELGSRIAAEDGAAAAVSLIEKLLAS